MVNRKEAARRTPQIAYRQIAYRQIVYRRPLSFGPRAAKRFTFLFAHA